MSVVQDLRLWVLSRIWQSRGGIVYVGPLVRASEFEPQIHYVRCAH